MNVRVKAAILQDLHNLLNSKNKPVEIKGGMIDIQYRLSLVPEDVFNHPDDNKETINHVWKSIANIANIGEACMADTHSLNGLRKVFTALRRS